MRLGWDQRTAAASEIGAIRYALYVDNARSELSNATCAPAADGAFACSASLPALAPGMHTLQLASFIDDGSVIESSRSTALRVNVVASTASAAGRPQSDPQPGAPAPSVRQWRDTLVDFGNGVVFRLEVVADDVDDPSDMAIAPDGRLFIAERGGRVRVVPGASEAVVSDGRLLALALDPQFERTHFVYAISTAARASADPTFVLARFREVSNTFGDRVILLDNIRAGEAAGAALRFGPDGALYAAFDDGGDEAAANDLASPQGKVLRMNADGSTPVDQAGGNPLFAAGFRSPRGMAWQPGSAMLWVAERRGTLAAVDVKSDAADRKKRGVTRRQYALPESIAPSSIAFAGDDLLVAAGPGRHLLRIRFDRPNPLTIAGTDRLLQDRVGPLHVVAAGPDGTIYIAADGAIARLVRAPEPPPAR